MLRSQIRQAVSAQTCRFDPPTRLQPLEWTAGQKHPEGFPEAGTGRIVRCRDFDVVTVIVLDVEVSVAVILQCRDRVGGRAVAVCTHCDVDDRDGENQDPGTGRPKQSEVEMFDE
ncbi:hypothetical protein TSUKUMMB_40980 [Rhodococcus sp. no. 34]